MLYTDIIHLFAMLIRLINIVMMMMMMILTESVRSATYIWRYVAKMTFIGKTHFFIWNKNS